MDSVTIKELTKNDIPAIRELFFSCNDYFTLIDGVSVCGCRAEVELDNADDGRKHYKCGIYSGSILIGVMFAIEAYPTLHSFTITLLLISPSYRNQGIGKQVLSLIEDIAREKGYDKIIVGIDEINSQAIQFWVRNGFSETGQRQRLQHAQRIGDILHFEKVLI